MASKKYTMYWLQTPSLYSSSAIRYSSPAMAIDPYAVLGVARDASPTDVKKAYRRLSKEWHPDKHKGDQGAENRFKEINEAYEILNDPRKKESFGRFGSAGGPGGGFQGGFPGFDASSFSSGGLGDFADMFEGFFGGRGGGRVREEGQDQEIEVTLEVRDVLQDVQKTVRLRALRPCSTCEGKGMAKGASLESCTQCGGTGQTTRTAQSFFGTIQQRVVCSVCAGSGKVPTEPCATCSGEGRVRGERDVTINIPAGIADGQALRIRGEGEAGRRGAPMGDLFVRVRVRPDPAFERQEADIRSTESIPVLTAILGGEAEIVTLHGPVTLHVPEGTQPGQVFRIKAKGLPILGRSRMGDHYVEVRVEIPRKLTREERRILEEWRSAQG